MAEYQSAFEPLDFDNSNSNKTMGFSLDPNDLADSMDLASSCQLSDIGWSDKDPFDMYSWNLVGVNQSFNPLLETVNQLELEPHSSYISTPHELSAGYADCMIKTEDAFSASPISDPGSDLWSPSLLQDHKSSGSSPLDSIGAISQGRHNDDGEEDDDQSPKTMPRKPSNASTVSSKYSASSPLASPKSKILKVSNTNKSSRPVLSPEHDAVAVMKRKKAAHNAIEKRYRTNMNAKFLALGNAVPRARTFSAPSLASQKGTRKSSTYQAAPGSASGSANGQHDQHQQQQQQQNKSEILTNALSYIHELQAENSRLKTELLVLKENLLPRGSMMWRR